MSLRRALPGVLLPFVVSCVVATEPASGERAGEAADDLAVCAGATVEGIDVSEYQGNIDWSAVRASGRGFAFLRVSDGTGHVDPTFPQNWAGARQAGVARGAYQFFRASEDGAAQADLLLKQMGALAAGDIAPAADVEISDGVGPATLNEHLAQWVARIEQATGRTPFVYTSRALWPSLSGSSRFAGAGMWVASWGVSCPSVPAPWGGFSFWQYADNGHVPGVEGLVDLNRFNGTLAELEALGGGVKTTGATPGPRSGAGKRARSGTRVVPPAR